MLSKNSVFCLSVGIVYLIAHFDNAAARNTTTSLTSLSLYYILTVVFVSILNFAIGRDLVALLHVAKSKEVIVHVPHVRSWIPFNLHILRDAIKMQGKSEPGTFARPRLVESVLVLVNALPTFFLSPSIIIIIIIRQTNQRKPI